MMTALSRSRRLLLAALFLAYAGCFARAVGYAYVWDDVKQIEKNPLLDRPLAQGLLASQTGHSDPVQLGMRGASLTYDSYRPLLFLSYRVDTALFGRSPAAMHAHNLLLGALNVALVYLFVGVLLPRRPGTRLAVAAVFGLHPAQVESVVYISARGDLLAAAFALVAGLLFLYATATPSPFRSRFRLLQIVGAALALLASLLSKEAYLGLPVVMLMIVWIRGRVRASAWPLAAIFATLPAYLALRLVLIGENAGGVSGLRLTDLLWKLPSAALQYLRVFVLPLDMSTERLYRPGWEGLSWGLWAVAVAGAFSLLRRRREESCDGPATLAVVGLFSFAALIAPSVLAVGETSILADRYLYLPLVGLSFAGVGALSPLLEGRRLLRRPLIIGLGAWGIVLLGVSALQVPVWMDNLSLYRRAVTAEPASSMAHYRLGYALARRGAWKRARRRFMLATRLDATNVRAFNNLGVAELELGRLIEARRAFRAATRLRPRRHYRAWLNLGVARLRAGDAAGACRAIGRALRINPRYGRARAVWDRRCRLASEVRK